VQYPGVVHLQVAERVLQYVRGTCDEGLGLTYFDPWNQEQVNRLGGLVVTSEHMKHEINDTGYLMSLNGGAISGNLVDPIETIFSKGRRYLK
jgi:hypothetical protein